VSGDGEPIPNGDYFDYGTYNDLPAYRTADLSCYLWSNGQGDWFLSIGEPPGGDDYWELEQAGPAGQYAPKGTATGNPIVAPYEP
jgi:hypothetical protein